jgi:hypothetical protein
MRVALVSRTIVLAGWVLLVLWHGRTEPAGIASAAALPALWTAALVRDRRLASPSRAPAP